MEVFISFGRKKVANHDTIANFLLIFDKKVAAIFTDDHHHLHMKDVRKTEFVSFFLFLWAWRVEA